MTFPKKTINFELTEEQTLKFMEWRDNLPEGNYGAIGGAITFEFTGTSLGQIVKVIYCQDTARQQVLDLSDYENW